MRVLTILTAYFGAAVAGSIMLALGMSVGSSLRESSSFLDFFTLLLPVVLVIAAPVAIPVIIYSEYSESDGWWVFAMAGATIGVLAMFLLADTFELKPFLQMLGTTVSAALAYWFFAWRMFPPKAASQFDRSTE